MNQSRNHQQQVSSRSSLSAESPPRWLHDLELSLDREPSNDEVAQGAAGARAVLIVAFAISPEVALLPIRSLRAAHLAEFFLGTLNRMGCTLRTLAPEATFDAIVFSFSHDYTRRFRRRAQRLSAAEILCSIRALFDFADRQLGFPNAARNHAACSFERAESVLSSAIDDGRLGRTFAR